MLIAWILNFWCWKMVFKKAFTLFKTLLAILRARQKCLLILLSVASFLYVQKFNSLLDTVKEGIESERHVGLYYMNKDQPRFVKWQNGNGYKTLLLWTEWFGRKGWYVGLGAGGLYHRKCPEKHCVITFDRDKLHTADMVLFHARDIVGGVDSMPRIHPSDQRWVFVSQESPENTYTKESWFHPSGDFTQFDGMFNTTMTYMRNSDIPIPYGLYQNKSKVESRYQFDITNKTSLILWFVSNCNTKGALERMQFAKEMQSYVSVDIYGTCGLPDPCLNGNWNLSCNTKLKSRYKFYLAFENSKCRDYITEKFWMNLKFGMVPIVMGAEMEDYQSIAPPNSFIHVDNFTSIEALAKYVSYLDKNDQAYLAYHEWRKYYSTKVEFDPRNDNWCTLCELAHRGPSVKKSYNISDFWSAKKQCK